MGGNSGLSFPSSEFDEFLFALVGEQQNGMPVSVFSALARLGIDPWREAKRLSDLPTDGAIGALKKALAGLADVQWAKIDTAGIAARLIRLLPSHGGAAASQSSRNNPPPHRPSQSSVVSVVWSRLSATPGLAWLALAALLFVAMTYFSSIGGAPSSAPLLDGAPTREQGRR